MRSGENKMFVDQLGPEICYVDIDRSSGASEHSLDEQYGFKFEEESSSINLKRLEAKLAFNQNTLKNSGIMLTLENINDKKK